MSKKKLIILGIALGVVLIAIISSAYIVDEKEQVVITQFGRPIGVAVTTPGVNFKVPFIQTANVFDKRYLEWDGKPNQIPTKDKKFIFIDTYARWQITDPLQFYKRLTDERGAQTRLNDILDGETRDYIANHELVEAVRNSNREARVTDTLTEPSSDTLIDIKVGREKIEKMILKTGNQRVSDLGIVILDFKIKRLNYVEEVRQNVFKRMNSERFRIADKFRSQGQGEASKINGKKVRDLKTIQSTAFEQAEKIKGKADASAAAIYAEAYNQSAQSKKLYSFLKSMETFENTFDAETSVILSTDSELYKYLKSKQ
ncbi:protease modulator HflC [Aequorivita marina]|uniref:protease modulator HflC n=1 Tax=Aequorivita marina TaxID=3073654 RepID=UPI00287503BF|nr:protease modulator HflC [Aequorivita sp. S2608]MDS1299535.1 protease modulator HflC [Aequorivita sp. S2608]